MQKQITMPAEKDNLRFKDHRTKQRIHEHLRNQHDHISEEDIRNVKTDFVADDSVPSNETTQPALPLADADKATQDPGIETTWNILK